MIERSLQHLHTALSNQKDASATNTVADAIRPVGSLHLTLGVMSLKDEERVEGALKLLDEIDLESVLNGLKQSPEERLENTKGDADDPGPQSGQASPDKPQRMPIEISLESLHTMKKASKTTNLFTSPSDPTNRLLPFCSVVKDIFTKAGFILEENRPLKLHATVINTIYAKKAEKKGEAAAGEESKSRTDEHRTRSKRRRPPEFDATEMIKTFEGFKWAEAIRVERLAICKMGANKIKDEEGRVVDENYEEIASKLLPE